MIQSLVLVCIKLSTVYKFFFSHFITYNLNLVFCKLFWFLFCMSQHMERKSTRSRISLRADEADKGFLTCMNHNMRFQSTTQCKLARAQVARIWLLSSVCTQVVFQLTSLCGTEPTVWTRMRLFPEVATNMPLNVLTRLIWAVRTTVKFLHTNITLPDFCRSYFKGPMIGGLQFYLLKMFFVIYGFQSFNFLWLS